MYVIYNPKTSRTISILDRSSFASAAGAKTSLTAARLREQKYNVRRLANGGRAYHDYEDLKIASHEEYLAERKESTKVVRNLMSGKEVVIDVNTPTCCDPSSETYWSM